MEIIIKLLQQEEDKKKAKLKNQVKKIGKSFVQRVRGIFNPMSE
jgi:hypothetical protein